MYPGWASARASEGDTKEDVPFFLSLRAVSGGDPATMQSIKDRFQKIPLLGTPAFAKLFDGAKRVHAYASIRFDELLSSIESTFARFQSWGRRTRTGVSRVFQREIRFDEKLVLISALVVFLLAIPPSCHKSTEWGRVYVGLALSYLAGVIFWILCILIPTVKNRMSEKKWLLSRYHQTKRRLLQCVLESANIWPNSGPEIEPLMSPVRFRAFVERKRDTHGDFFDVAESNWNADPAQMNDVKFHLMQLVSGIEDTLRKIGSNDRAVFDRLSFFCYRTREVFSVQVYACDLAKYVGDDLVYPRLAAWHYNPSPAQKEAFKRGHDLMEEDIENL